jgi:hypothetical protein
MRTSPQPDAVAAPVVDLTRVVMTAEVVLGAVVIAHRLARRPTAPGPDCDPAAVTRQACRVTITGGPASRGT